MKDEQDDNECPGTLPDEEVAQAIKQQWSRLRAVPAARMVGGLNMLFGVLAFIGGIISIAAIVRVHNRWAGFNHAGMAETALQMMEREARAFGAEDRAEEFAEDQQLAKRERENGLTRDVVAFLLRMANAAFLALTGWLLWQETAKAQKLARIALWLIPVEFVVSCIVFWPPLAPGWTTTMTEVCQVVTGFCRPLRMSIAVTGWLWTIVYPLLALRALRREADIEVHLQEAPPA
jgi:hypothetical protein